MEQASQRVAVRRPRSGPPRGEPLPHRASVRAGQGAGRWPGRLLTVGVCGAVVAELVRVGAGVRGSSLQVSWQLIDIDVLRHDPLRSVWYLHTQPPLHNLVV